MIFYGIILVLLVLYYLVMAPKTIRNTLKMIGLMAVLAALMVFVGWGVINLFRSPPQIYIILVMTVLGLLCFKDVCYLSQRPLPKSLARIWFEK